MSWQRDKMMEQEFNLRDVIAAIALHGLLVHGNSDSAYEAYSIADDFLRARKGEPRAAAIPQPEPASGAEDWLP